MLDYLYYLKDKLVENEDEGFVCSVLIHDKRENDISLYNLTEAYFIACKEVQDKFDKMKKELCSNDNNLDNKIKSVFKNIKITDVTQCKDGYKFFLSISTPFKDSVYLMMRKKDNSDVSKKVDVIKLIKSCNDIGEYELLAIDRFNTKPLSIALAAIFYENVNAEELYNLLGDMEKVWRNGTYQVVTDDELPMNIELYQNGKVSLKSTLNNFSYFSAIYNEILNIYNLSCDANNTMQNDPIWYFENLYVNKESIKNESLLANINKDANILRDMFKTSGYGNTINLSNGEIETGVSKSYYIEGEQFNYREIKDFKSVSYDKTKEVYYFRYDDGSVMEIPKNKIVIIYKDISLDKTQAILSLENKSR